MNFLERILSSDNPLSSRRAQALLSVLVALGLAIYDVVAHGGLTGYSTGLLGGLTGISVTAVAVSKQSSSSAPLVQEDERGA